MSCNAMYFQKNAEVFWKCPNNMGPQTPRPLSSVKCWKYNCPGRKNVDTQILCSYELCQKPRRPGSKYCEDSCRKKKARRDYKMRQKVK